MSAADVPETGPTGGEVPRRKRPTIDAPLSVLKILAAKTGDAPRVSLSEEDSGTLGSPPIDPGTAERYSLPEGRGAYQILGEIARGGMGVVLRGHDTDLGRDVAMKVLSKELADRPEVVRRFVEEAQIGGQLQHPGIVPVYELGLMADERPYFTMKLVKGRTLAMLLAERSSVSDERRNLIDVFRSVCRTMAYAHSRGVIHRDLKPANIMVGAFGEVQVVDWGLAKVLARGGTADEKRARTARAERTVEGTVERTVLETVRSDGSGSGTDSMVGSVLGTPAYMPPEQATGMVDRLDERSDVFSLGAILCEILTGAPPYAGEQEKTLMQAAQAELDDALARLAGCDADAELVKIARQCLVAAKQARPRNAGVLAESVDAYLASVEERARTAEIAAVEARVHASEERRARRLTLALATSLVAVLVLGGAGWVWRERQRHAEAARVEAGLEQLSAEVARLRDEGEVEDAVRTARGALPLVEGLAEADTLHTRAQELVAATEAAAARARAEERKAQADAVLLGRLEELRLEASRPASAQAHVELDTGFQDAFHAWGLDVEQDLVHSLEVLRASGIEGELAPALDDWASVRRWAYGWRSYEAEAMNSLAADLDPEPVRVRMREALMERDAKSLLAIVSSGEVEQLPASSIWVLANALKDLGSRELALGILEQAVGRFPTDLRLRMTLATMSGQLGRRQEALRHVSAAVALRPELQGLRVLEGQALADNSRLPSAARAFERALAIDARDASALHGLMEVHLDLGHVQQALGFAQRLAEVRELEAPEEVRRITAEYLLGHLDIEELTRQALAIGGYGPLGPAWMLLWGHPEDRDPERALALMEGLPSSQDLDDLLASLRAEAALQLGQPEVALERLRTLNDADQGFFDPGLKVSIQAHRARAFHALGEESVALELLAEARRQVHALTADEPEAWKDSWMLADLRRAEEELAR